MIRNLVLSGGSIHTVKILGLLSCLEDNNILNMKNIEKYISSSGGSILSILLACGYTPKELYNMIKALYIRYEEYINTEMSEKLIDGVFMDIFEFKGLLSTDFVKSYLIEVIKSKIHLDDPTFIEFTKSTGILLNICASNITDHKYEVFSIDTYPNVKVIDAVCASISIPIIFQPFKISKTYYLDSGLLNNFPVEYLDKNNDNASNSIGVRIVCGYQKEKDDLNFISFIGSIYKTYMNQACKTYNDSDIDIYDIIIEEEDTYADLDINTFKFNINEKIIDKFFNEGYNIAFKKISASS